MVVLLDARFARAGSQRRKVGGPDRWHHGGKLRLPAWVCIGARPGAMRSRLSPTALLGPSAKPFGDRALLSGHATAGGPPTRRCRRHLAGSGSRSCFAAGHARRGGAPSAVTLNAPPFAQRPADRRRRDRRAHRCSAASQTSRHTQPACPHFQPRPGSIRWRRATHSRRRRSVDEFDAWLQPGTRCSRHRFNRRSRG